MSSYLTTLLTTTTSRYASLRSLLPSLSEADGDTEDDTHLCRVLRAYYLEKGRPFPAWLPPDPKAPQPAIQPVYTSSAPVGAGYGGLQAASSGSTASKLGSLWDSQPANTQQGNGPQSLRPGGRSAGVSSSALRGGRPEPYSRSQLVEPAVQARPLPSQRAGSIQTAGRSETPPGGAGTGAAATAQDRLKARLWGAAKAAGGSGGAGQGQAGQQNRGSPAPSGFERGGNTGIGSAYGSGGRAAGGRYEDGSMGMGSPRSGVGGEKPFVAATAPWASNEDEFMGGGYGGGGSGYERAAGGGIRNGLPTGPGRRPGAGGGLPSGPRSTR